MSFIIKKHFAWFKSGTQRYVLIGFCRSVSSLVPRVEVKYPKSAKYQPWRLLQLHCKFFNDPHSKASWILLPVIGRQWSDPATGAAFKKSTVYGEADGDPAELVAYFSEMLVMKFQLSGKRRSIVIEYYTHDSCFYRREILTTRH